MTIMTVFILNNSPGSNDSALPVSKNMWSKTHVTRIIFIVIEPHELLLVLKYKREILNDV